MTIATFKDLCVDARDPELLGGFWSRLLGLEMHQREDGVVRLAGSTKEHTIWVNPVPEPKTVKHRVHFDVQTRSVAEVEALGASVVQEQPHWTVMADPEGGEFCVFGDDDVPARSLYAVTFDSDRDHRRIAEWWAGVLGGSLSHHDGWSAVADIAGAPMRKLLFMPVPEPKVVKNRVHLDLTTDDVAALEAAGATVLRAPDDEIAWTVMADPDGNEFCAFLR